MLQRISPAALLKRLGLLLGKRLALTEPRICGRQLLQARGRESGAWLLESQEDWAVAMADAENMELVEGYVEPTAEKASFRSIVKIFPERRKLSSIVFEQG